MTPESQEPENGQNHSDPVNLAGSSAEAADRVEAASGRFTSNWPRRLRDLRQAILRLFSKLWRALLRASGYGMTKLRAAWVHERSRRLRAGLRTGAQRIRAVVHKAWPVLRRELGFGAKVLVLLFLIVATLFAGGRYASHTIEAGQIGVRATKWGGEGVVAQDFGPGVHLDLPGVHRWYSLPAGTDLLTWRMAAPNRAGKQLDVRTQDGTSISLSLTVPYRIQKGTAHRIVAKGHRGTYQAQALAKTEQVLLNEFSRLRTEEFSRSELRQELLDDALALLNTSLSEIHVQAEDILIDEIRFSEAYEKKLVETQRERQRGRVLEARQLEDQEQQTILRRRHEIDQEVLARRIELDREIEALRAEGQRQAVEAGRSISKYESDRRADAEREYESRIAQGKAQLMRAQGLERRLHAENLAGKGGDRFLALAALQATRLEAVTLNANDPRVPNPLDVSDMVGLFADED